MDNLRIIFSKSKSATNLTHIEVIRIFEEAFIKADIKIKYTEKKKPKPVITFADPLPRRVESIGEVVDVILIEKLDIPYLLKLFCSFLLECLFKFKAYKYCLILLLSNRCNQNILVKSLLLNHFIDFLFVNIFIFSPCLTATE